MLVYVFQCSNNDRRYGYSVKRDGANLPSNQCPGGTWAHLKSIDLNPGETLVGGPSVEMVLRVLHETGWLVFEAGVEPELMPQDKRGERKR